MSDKITQSHLERPAYVYLRQSTLQQLRMNTESTHRQYDLKRRALELGWAESEIRVVDHDLGKSGGTTENRVGFKHLAEEVSRGRVGAILALEISRLARSSADWYRLLELCMLTDAVLIDENQVYDPKDYGDKLVLGLKGQFSEAELYWMRLRLNGALLSKARRGQLRIPIPVGYIWDELDAIQFDPDESVRHAISMVFERFHVDHSARAVTRYFRQQKLQIPFRRQNGRVEWQEASYSRVLHILRNPIYAGTYAYGRVQRQKVVESGEIRVHVKQMPQESWHVLRLGSHPGYIDWDEFTANQRRLYENKYHHQVTDQRGAPRGGHALLQGLTLCGRCGRRMSVGYWSTDGSRAIYRCYTSAHERSDGKLCWNVAARSIDEAVSELFLQTIQPAELALSVAVVDEVESQIQSVAEHWRLRLERVQYEARLAERRYLSVDPDNRLVARTLERAWNEKLRELEELKHEQQRHIEKRRLSLSPKEREEILALAHDLPRVWYAKTTTLTERKSLLRIVIEEISLTPVDIPERETLVRVLWKTGEVTELRVPRPFQGMQYLTPRRTLDELSRLCAQDMTNQEVAQALNEAGIPSGKGRRWTDKMVSTLRHKYHFPRSPNSYPNQGCPLPERRDDGRYSVPGLAKLLGVSVDRIRYWCRSGLLNTVRDAKIKSRVWIEFNDAVLERLRTLRKLPGDRQLILSEDPSPDRGA